MNPIQALEHQLEESDLDNFDIYYKHIKWESENEIHEILERETSRENHGRRFPKVTYFVPG